MDNINQKMKLHYLENILKECTDEQHPLTSSGIIELLERDGVKIERKTLYKDIALLREFGLDIIQEKKGRNVYYYVGQREFELPELKLLVDLVQASKFITKKKSMTLIKKLEAFTSKYEASELQRQLYVTDNAKVDNEKIYYNVDMIHSAINANKSITYQYFQWTVEKKKELRHDGKIYNVSPWALLWDHEKYYMIGFDEDIKEIRHYRVDKIINLKLVTKTRQGIDEFKKYNISSYTKKTFGMFEGEEKMVTLRVGNSLAGVIIDRFGRNIDIKKVNKSQFETTVKVALSDQFYGWILALGNDIKIISPKEAKAGIIELINQRQKVYEK